MRTHSKGLYNTEILNSAWVRHNHNHDKDSILYSGCVCCRCLCWGVAICMHCSGRSYCCFDVVSVVWRFTKSCKDKGKSSL